MSLQPATKEVSSSPSKGTVIDPTNRAAQAADVDRKLRFFGVIQAFRQGRLPSNTQIDETLQYVLAHSPVTVSSLSPPGQKLVQDVRDIIDTVRLIVQEKNADELLQNFIFHTQDVDAESIKNAALDDAVGGVPKSREDVKRDSDKALGHLRTLLALVLSNSEVRKLLSDFSLITRDLLSIGASKLASGIAPSPSALSNVDQTAPKDQFTSAGGKPVGPHETPVLDREIPLPSGGPFSGGDDEKMRVRMHPKEDAQPVLYKQGAGINDGDGMENGKPVGEVFGQGFQAYHDVRQQGLGMAKEAATGRPQEEVRDETRGVAGQVGRQGGEGLREARNEAEVYREGDRGLKEEKKRGVMNRVRQFKDNLKDGFNERVPEEHRDRIAGNVEGTKKFFTEEYFPKERRDQFIYRFKKVIVECQKHDDYQESIRWLLGYLEEYGNHGQTATSTLRESTFTNAGNAHKLTLALLELRTLLERLASNTSLTPLLDSLSALASSAQRDPALRAWFSSVDAYMRKVLLEPGYVMEPECERKGRGVWEDGRVFWGADAGEGEAGGKGVYREQFEDVGENIGGWFTAFGDDPINKRFGTDVSRLTHDLLFAPSSPGTPPALKFKPELWNDLRRVILPQLVQTVGYIPIPRVEYVDEGLDLVVENLTLQGRNLVPSVVQVDVESHVKFSPYDAISDESHTRISLTLSQIQADMRDVAFYYRKKTGLPRMKDSGLADVLIGGAGISIHVVLIAKTGDAAVAQNTTAKHAAATASAAASNIRHDVGTGTNAKHTTQHASASSNKHDLNMSTSDPTSLFTLSSVSVKVHNLKFKIRDSKHDFLYKTLGPLATGLVKRQIEKAVEGGVRTGVGYLDEMLVAVRERVTAATTSDGGETGGIANLFARTKSPETSTASVHGGSIAPSTHSIAHTHSTSNSQFKLVANKRKSLLSDVGNPAGWVNRAAEKNEMAKAETGLGVDNWKSEAFNIIQRN